MAVISGATLGTVANQVRPSTVERENETKSASRDNIEVTETPSNDEDAAAAVVSTRSGSEGVLSEHEAFSRALEASDRIRRNPVGASDAHFTLSSDAVKKLFL